MVGRVLFGVSYGDQLGLLCMALVVFAWVSAGLGVFIGAVVKDPEKVQGLCTLLSLMAAALGGCWWPMEIVPEFMRTVGHAFPTAWAMDIMNQLLSFGGGFAEIKSELLVLVGYATITTFLAGKFLRV